MRREGLKQQPCRRSEPVSALLDSPQAPQTSPNTQVKETICKTPGAAKSPHFGLKEPGFRKPVPSNGMLWQRAREAVVRSGHSHA